MLSEKSSLKPSEKLDALVIRLRLVASIFGADVLKKNYKPNWIVYTLYFNDVLYKLFLIYTIQLKFKDDWKIVLETLSVSGSEIQGLAKLTMAVVHSKKVARTFINIINIFKRFEGTDAYDQILLNSLKEYKIAILMNILAYFTLMMAIWMFPMYYFFQKNQKLLPIHFLVPGLSIETTSGYFTLYFFQACYVFVAGVGNIVGDTVFLIFALTIRLHKQIFRQKINDFNVKLRKNQDGRRIEVKELTEWLNEYCHFSSDVIEILFWVIAVEIFCCAFGAISSLFIIMTGDWPAAYPNFGCNIISLYLFCCIGTIAEITADDVIDMIYEIEWYNLQVRDQKIVRLMLMKSQQKIVFTVAGVTPLTINTALQVSKTIYSYWMMLTNFVK